MMTHPLQILSENYLSTKKYSVSTLKRYRIVYKQFISYLIQKDITYAKTSDFITYRQSKRHAGYSSVWIDIQVSALKGLYHYLSTHQGELNLPLNYVHNIMEPVKKERAAYHIKKAILTPEQSKHMLLTLKGIRKYLWHYRDYAIVYLMLTSGLRPTEIIHAKRSDYKTEGAHTLLYMGDGFVKVSDGAKLAIDDYLEKRSDDNPNLFISHKQTTKTGGLSHSFFIYSFPRILNICGLEGLGITPYSLRHTAATFNLLRGGTVIATQNFMRHVDIQSTLVYDNYLKRLADDTSEKLEAHYLKESSFKYLDFISFLES